MEDSKIDIEAVYELILSIEVSLEYQDSPDMQYVSTKLVECREGTNKLQREITLVTKEKSFYEQELYRLETLYEVKKDARLASDSAIKTSGGSLEDRKAAIHQLEDIAGVLHSIRENNSRIKALANVEKVLALRLRGLDKTGTDIRQQFKAMELQMKHLNAGDREDKDLEHLHAALATVGEIASTEEVVEDDGVELELTSDEADDLESYEVSLDLDTSPDGTGTPVLEVGGSIESEPEAPLEEVIEEEPEQGVPVKESIDAELDQKAPLEEVIEEEPEQGVPAVVGDFDLLGSLSGFATFSEQKEEEAQDSKPSPTAHEEHLSISLSADLLDGEPKAEAKSEHSPDLELNPVEVTDTIDLGVLDLGVEDLKPLEIVEDVAEVGVVHKEKLSEESELDVGKGSMEVETQEVPELDLSSFEFASTEVKGSSLPSETVEEEEKQDKEAEPEKLEELDVGSSDELEFDFTSFMGNLPES
jgi:hypothetical protein